MVLGFSMAVIRVPLVSQCAETTRTAFGTGILFAIFAQPLLKLLSCIPLIGEPCPIKSTGIFSVAGKLSLMLRRLLKPIVAAPTGNKIIAFKKSFLFMFSI